MREGEDAAWQLYIRRLAECLAKACARRAADKNEPAADEEYGQLLADVFCVNHYMWPSKSPAPAQ